MAELYLVESPDDDEFYNNIRECVAISEFLNVMDLSYLHKVVISQKQLIRVIIEFGEDREAKFFHLS